MTYASANFLVGMTVREQLSRQLWGRRRGHRNACGLQLFLKKPRGPHMLPWSLRKGFCAALLMANHAEVIPSTIAASQGTTIHHSKPARPI